MSAAAAVLPFVWAKSAVELVEQGAGESVLQGHGKPVQEAAEVAPEIAFYRKYTEGLLRRYLRCSMEAGKVPSLLGKEMFRAKVSSYRMTSFEDIVIFIHDVGRCLEWLDEEQQQLVARIALQEYTIDETAELTGLRPKTVVRRYRQAIDRLTRIFLAVEMLHPQNDVKGVRARRSL